MSFDFSDARPAPPEGATYTKVHFKTVHSRRGDGGRGSDAQLRERDVTPLDTGHLFHETLLSFRSAVLRYAYTIRLLHIKRRFTSKKLKTPPEEARKRFAALVTINELDYKFKLTTAFQKALNDQEAAVTLYYSYPPTPGNHPPAH